MIESKLVYYDANHPGECFDSLEEVQLNECDQLAFDLLYNILNPPNYLPPCHGILCVDCIKYCVTQPKDRGHGCVKRFTQKAEEWLLYGGYIERILP